MRARVLDGAGGDLGGARSAARDDPIEAAKIRDTKPPRRA